MQGDDASGTGKQLASELEPLRQPLAAYFRRRIRDAAEVDDLVQEVFARILSRDSDRPVDHLASYVFQTAASVLADRSRRRSARQTDAHTSFDPEQHGEQDFGPDRIMSAKQDLAIIRSALLTLPERTRIIFVLHRLEGWKYKDIAVRIGISKSAVEKHIVKAVQHLVQSLGAGHEF
jgi:RNA polymerase sigma-70 factor (ECF subfamily)